MPNRNAASKVVASSRMESFVGISCPRSPGDAARPSGSLSATPRTMSHGYAEILFRFRFVIGCFPG